MKTDKVINPATGEVIAEVKHSDIPKAIEQAHQAFHQGPWPKLSLGERKNYLLRIAKGMLDKAQELAELETKNTGKPLKESTFMDIPSSIKTFEYFANNLERYLSPEEITLEAEGVSHLHYEPRGVTLLIVPWNYPLLIASWKMAQSLACGNTILLKPSSLTPLTALMLSEIIQEAGLPEGVVNVLNVRGGEVGPLLCSHPDIDMISFTGSTSSGKEIMRFASSNTKKLIMELGGKSASIVMADCDLEATVNAALTSIFLNQGQMCTAMSRILVDKRIAKEFIEQFTEKAKRIKLGNGLDPETQMGPLISAEHREGVLSFVEEAKAEGARLLCGGKIPDKAELNKGFFFEPAVFTDVKPDMKIFQEEVFGPVVSMLEFSQEEEAVKLANDSSFGLAASIWSKDLEKAERISKDICAGTVWINTYGMFYNEAPYGGFKGSGFGKELGKEGLREYCRTKHINSNSLEEKPLVSFWYAF
ncbi:MAG: aldehyde dehydrogenase family protein [Candidatus Omnitrophota bacterium]|nr:MAG: aldehyde dehydrogenase family protein [Candidatus Omnitrophota bacterium]